MNTYILVAMWLVASPAGNYSETKYVTRSTAVAMQEFNTLERCKFVANDLNKRPGMVAYCTPK